MTLTAPACMISLLPHLKSKPALGNLPSKAGSLVGRAQRSVLRTSLGSDFFRIGDELILRLTQDDGRCHLANRLRRGEAPAPSRRRRTG